MPRIRIHSDLHLEFANWEPPAVEADVVVLAGDIHVGVAGLRWMRRYFPDTPIVYVPGNHEYFHARLHDVLDALRAAAQPLGIHVLDMDEAVLAGVRFLGATLWTDFAIYGAEPEQVAHTMAAAKRLMHDYRVIRYGPQGKFKPEHSLKLHREHVQWLERRLAVPYAGPTVVVSHHLPHRRSIHPKFEDDPLNPGFASDLAYLVRPPVRLWVHGHTHESLDYVVGGTRVVCNPRGYVPMQPNHAFDPRLVVTVADSTGTLE
jgi:predicted phosphodiesterase